jgi:hypothetical protein
MFAAGFRPVLRCRLRGSGTDPGFGPGDVDDRHTDRDRDTRRARGFCAAAEGPAAALMSLWLVG